MFDTNENAHGTLAARIDRLERSNRRLRNSLITVVLAAAGLALTGLANSESMQGPTQREIQTQRLVIVGADQQPRVMLHGNSDGATVCLYGPDQPELTDPRPTGQETSGSSVTTGFSSLAPRMRLMVEGEECRVELIAPGGKTRATLRYDADGPALELLDEEGNPIES